MATINEIKEQMSVVASVGDFTNALQQIATIRMMKLREHVLESRPYVEAANTMLAELTSVRNRMHTEDLLKLEKKKGKGTPAMPGLHNQAFILVTSNQGLTGLYNIEIYKRFEQILDTYKEADFFIIGKKGQEVFANGKYKVHNYPYEVPDNFTAADLQRLIRMFDLYSNVTLMYSRFINTATREVVTLSVVNPVAIEEEPNKKAEKTDKAKEVPIKYMCEPDIDQLIANVTASLRGALFQQQIMDARLSQNAAQMIGMKTASDNAVGLLADLRMDYNKQRRKMIDKKIGEVFAGSALW